MTAEGQAVIEAQELVDALEAELVDLDQKIGEAGKRLAALQQRRDNINGGWHRKGELESARRVLEAAKQAEADSHRTHLQFTRSDFKWVVVAAGNVQVRVRAVGGPRTETLRRADASIRWLGDVVGGKDALEAAIAEYKALKK